MEREECVVHSLFVCVCVWLMVCYNEMGKLSHIITLNAMMRMAFMMIAIAVCLAACPVVAQVQCTTNSAAFTVTCNDTLYDLSVISRYSHKS